MQIARGQIKRAHPTSINALGLVYKEFVSLSRWFYFDVGFRAHTADSFLLHGQKKRTLKTGIKNQRKGRPDDLPGKPRRVPCASRPLWRTTKLAQQKACSNMVALASKAVCDAPLRHTGLKSKPVVFQSRVGMFYLSTRN